MIIFKVLLLLSVLIPTSVVATDQCHVNATDVNCAETNFPGGRCCGRTFCCQSVFGRNATSSGQNICSRQCARQYEDNFCCPLFTCCIPNPLGNSSAEQTAMSAVYYRYTTMFLTATISFFAFVTMFMCVCCHGCNREKWKTDLNQSEAVRAFRSRYPAEVRNTRALVYVVREPRVTVVKNIVKGVRKEDPPNYNEVTSNYKKYPLKK